MSPSGKHIKDDKSTEFKDGKLVHYNKDDEDHSNISSAGFPEDFLFGSGTSAYQVEGGYVKGGKTLSVWDVFSLSCPGGIVDGSNGNLACNSFRKYKEDLRVMDQMGFNSYRFSISWPRILPGGRSCFGINRKGIAYYNSIIDTCIANGLEPFVTLFHWDTPDCLELEYGGFLDKRIINDFRDFAEICFWEFGDRVKYWTTLNEPYSYTFKGYISGDFPPCRRDNIDDNPSDKGNDTDNKKPTIERYSNKYWSVKNSQAPYIVARNLLLAHSEAVHSYRTKFQKRQNGIIGIALNSNWMVPKDHPDPPKPEDVEAAKRGVDFMLGWFLDPIVSGKYPDSMVDRVKENLQLAHEVFVLSNLPGFSSQEKEKLIGSIDFLGLNYYTTYYAEDKVSDNPESNYDKYRNIKIIKDNKEGIPIGEKGGSKWLYSVPWGLYEHLNYLKEKLQDKTPEGFSKRPPIYITENGWSDASDFNKTPHQACEDTERKKYYHDHLYILKKAIDELKVDVKGYFAWSWCDNFEWDQGYKERFGLMYVDFLNEYERYPKNSAVWFTEFLAEAAERKKNKKKNLETKLETNLETKLETILKKLLDHEAKDSETTVQIPTKGKPEGVNHNDTTVHEAKDSETTVQIPTKGKPQGINHNDTTVHEAKDSETTVQIPTKGKPQGVNHNDTTGGKS